MANIMLAIGAILSAIGLYAIASGYPIIEIERGWASVIAGSVLLSGGLVVAALGLVLRSLSRLRAALPAANAPAGPPAVYAEPRLAPVTEAPYASPVVPSHEPLGAAVPALAVAAPVAAAALAAGFAARHEPADATEPPPHEDVHEPPPAPPIHDPVEDHATPDWNDREFAAFDYEAEHAPRAQASPTPPDSAGESGPHVDEPVAAAAVHVAPHEPEPETPHELDKEAPHDVADHQASEPPLGEHPVNEHDPASHTAASEAPEEHAPHPAEAPATAPETPPANLTVIGRYDSEGTSYVMYSDGSIEAQSEAGVYRFGSMAELKAFIEG